MRLILNAKDGDMYSGNIRSVSHDSKRKTTKVVFTGSVSKFFKDEDKLGINFINAMYVEKKNIVEVEVDSFKTSKEEIGKL